MTWQATQDYPREASSPAHARQFCTRQLSALLTDSSGSRTLIDSAELIVSELVTNSVNAGCSYAGVRLSVQDGSLRIAVRDNADGGPVLQVAGLREQHGRGLSVIATVATRWGVERTADGKQIWAELRLPSA
jgi:signal transduction histidine kinase